MTHSHSKWLQEKTHNEDFTKPKDGWIIREPEAMRMETTAGKLALSILSYP